MKTPRRANCSLSASVIAYLPVMSGEGTNEKRAITEFTSRFKLPLAILMSDRNYFDFRFVSGQDFS
jgi:hypothetical protein